ncbi:hypothetical protein TWF192_005665 [Orbilia oligospora]|uniref:Uncharacterized protein n=1 Tax=Orbilia oligospora TaxID=2813651 RepID=A0A6G1MNG6_ORBOL|nr:hypothetical protein TWF679_002245 [Orbilia oligospora]KAF3231997.1 hypothetical protein TWF191_003972 [Orbilia oligospora]KAF3263383.1 hypothetical protein TWF192_005665 [Orbilia oligospora]
MLLRIFTILVAFGGLVGAIPVPDEAHVGEGLLSLKSRQTGHQEYFINLDEKSQMFWLELAYGDAFFTRGFFKNPVEDNMKKYLTLKDIVKNLLHPLPQVLGSLGGAAYHAPHGKCRVLYCNGSNLGVSLCSRRQGDEPEVSVNSEAIGNIVEEWVEAFKWQRASPKPKTDGDFKTPIYGRSFWSEDPGWSVNIEECGNTPIDFGQDVLHDT